MSGHVHHFDPVSGWCATCNYREDGRLISGGGDVWRPGPDYRVSEGGALERVEQPA